MSKPLEPPTGDAPGLVRWWIARPFPVFTLAPGRELGLAGGLERVCVGLAGAAEVLHEKPLQQRMVLGMGCMLCPPEIQRNSPRELRGARQIALIQ